MRRSLWVLEVKGRNGKWGRTQFSEATKGAMVRKAPGSMYLLSNGGEPGKLYPYRIVKYVPRDRPWWRFWG